MSNTHNSPSPIYPHIEAWSTHEYHCGERKAICPECFDSLCVFCEDSCPGCQSSVF